LRSRAEYRGKQQQAEDQENQSGHVPPLSLCLAARLRAFPERAKPVKPNFMLRLWAPPKNQKGK
jgi:hypothetical protein